MVRNDIVAHIPVAQMSLDQLAFRRNGHLHDIGEHRRRGDRESVLAAQQDFSDVEAEITRRLAVKVER